MQPFYLELSDEGQYMVMCRRTQKKIPLHQSTSKEEKQAIVAMLNEEVKLGRYQAT
jgi:hypothetical protein